MGEGEGDRIVKNMQDNEISGKQGNKERAAGEKRGKNNHGNKNSEGTRAVQVQESFIRFLDQNKVLDMRKRNKVTRRVPSSLKSECCGGIL